jgi:hypothetical protein
LTSSRHGSACTPAEIRGDEEGSGGGVCIARHSVTPVERFDRSPARGDSGFAQEITVE